MEEAEAQKNPELYRIMEVPAQESFEAGKKILDAHHHQIMKKQCEVEEEEGYHSEVSVAGGTEEPGKEQKDILFFNLYQMYTKAGKGAAQ